MYTCELCKKEFQTVPSLSTHLSHSKSKCKTDIKKYYDTYLRKENEGICKFCGTETLFYGIGKGYPNSVCKHCRNNSDETKEKRTKSFKENKEIKKINDGYYDLKEQCQICNENNKNIRFKTRSGLSKHIFQIHENISIKDYYDKYLKKEGEGICKVTGKTTNFKSMKDGYYEYLGSGTQNKDLQVREKINNKILERYGVTNPCFINQEIRIKNQKFTILKRNELKDERIRLVSILSKIINRKENRLKCQICKENFTSFSDISNHILNHNITVKDYYDKFFKKNKEGICKISMSETNFVSLENGYLEYSESGMSFIREREEEIKYLKNNIIELQKDYNVEFLNIDLIQHPGEYTDIKCLKCEKVYKNKFTNLITGSGKCPNCYPRGSRRLSKNQSEIFNLVKSILPDEEILCDYKKIKKIETNRLLELDIYIPSKKIAIEHNGLFHHSELNHSKADLYHLVKYQSCIKEGIQLIQIFEDEWEYKKDIVISIINRKLNDNLIKIDDIDCKIKEIDTETKNNFLNENHIHGEDYSMVNLGSFYKNELVSVMTFNLEDPYDQEKWELSRFCTKKEYQVIGIAGKLLKHFKSNYIWREIYSYADLRFSSGNMYYKLGFDLEKQNLPNYFYIRGTKRIHRYNLRKLPTEPKETPEWLLRRNQGYYRIWDCGTLKFSTINYKQ